MIVFLYGPSGSGKSTIGKLLAQKLALPWIDLDADIQEQIGSTIESFFATQGESAFRELESQRLVALIEKNPKAVISLGGGALLREQNWALVKKHGKVIVLNAELETLLARLTVDSYVRPLIKEDPRERLTALLERRKTHYASIGETFLTDNLTPEQIVRELQIKLGYFHITGMGNPYDVVVQPGILDELGQMLTARNLHGPCALVCDANVEPLYSDRVLKSLMDAGIETKKVIVPAGEEHKTIQTITSLWDGFVQTGVERNSFVLALGGGVIGDMTGFAAATFLRGVPWINVPTSLLAMVDSSLGGKTGADLPQGKNLIGAFHSPVLVASDPQVLSTLPSSELRNGLAETIKHGILIEPIIYQQLSKKGWPKDIGSITSLISRSVAVKAEVVEADPYEKGILQALNLGHTAGHGIETASNYRLSHGECVAIGMVVEARLAEKIGLAQPGLAEEIATALTRLGLPTQVPDDLDREAIKKAMSLDKKRNHKSIHFALPERIGKVRTGVVIDNWEELIEL